MISDGVAFIYELNTQHVAKGRTHQQQIFSYPQCYGFYQSQKDDAQALKSSWTEGGVEPVYETSCVLHQAKTVRGGR